MYPKRIQERICGHAKSTLIGGEGLAREGLRSEGFTSERFSYEQRKLPKVLTFRSFFR